MRNYKIIITVIIFAILLTSCSSENELDLSKSEKDAVETLQKYYSRFEEKEIATEYLAPDFNYINKRGKVFDLKEFLKSANTRYIFFKEEGNIDEFKITPKKVNTISNNKIEIYAEAHILGAYALKKVDTKYPIKAIIIKEDDFYFIQEIDIREFKAKVE